jgi:hypothetical protein
MSPEQEQAPDAPAAPTIETVRVYSDGEAVKRYRRQVRRTVAFIKSLPPQWRPFRMSADLFPAALPCVDWTAAVSQIADRDVLHVDALTTSMTHRACLWPNTPLESRDRALLERHALELATAVLALDAGEEPPPDTARADVALLAYVRVLGDALGPTTGYSEEALLRMRRQSRIGCP